MKTEVMIDAESLLGFINHDLLLNKTVSESIQAETDLIEMGVIDSLSLIQLVTHLEKTVGIEITDADVTPDNFQTVSKIIKYLAVRMEK